MVTVAFVLFCAVKGPMFPVEVLKIKMAAPVVPTGPPVLGNIKFGSAVQLNRTEEVDKCKDDI